MSDHTITKLSFKDHPTDLESLAFAREIRFGLLERYLYMINSPYLKSTMIIQITLAFSPSGICSPSNDHIVQLLDSLGAHLNQLKRCHQYVWILNRNQVYLCLLVDSIKPTDFQMIIAKSKEYWASALRIDSAEGLVYSGKHDHFIKNGFVLNHGSSDYEQAREICFCWITYVVAMKSKSDIPANIQGFGASQLPSWVPAM